MNSSTVSDEFVFAEEVSAAPAPHTTQKTQSPAVWHILVVDDEPDVHAATKLALKGIEIEGRSLAFSHAYSSQEAQALLAQNPDFAVALIDVVMEQQDAGLQLVRHIREVLGNTAIRVVLRTGQPGDVPELQTIQQYDINDYKTKSELTQERLFTSLVIAIRAYAQIELLQWGQARLARILQASLALGKANNLQGFAQNLLRQLEVLLYGNGSASACQEQGQIAIAVHVAGTAPYVLAASADCQHWVGSALEHVPMGAGLQQTLQAQSHRFDAQAVHLFIPSAHGVVLAVSATRSALQISTHSLEQGLLEVFASNAMIAFENLQLYLDINALAFSDDLVGLPNRNAMVAALDAQQYPQGVLALLDLDGFADINSVLDAHFGDAVLKAVAHRLHAEFAQDAVVARVGGDLFGVYGAPASIAPQRLLGVFAQPFAVKDGELLRLSATVGLVQLRSTDGVTALKDAGVALKQAKRQARGKSLYFDPAQSEAASQRMQRLNCLRAAFSEERLCLHYQPCVDLRTGQVVAAECLLRWPVPGGKFIPPDQFIPLAEQAGLMLALGHWVIATALRWRKSLVGRVNDAFRVAINVSQVQFAEPDFVEQVLALVAASGVQGYQVEIELTESVAVSKVEDVQAKLKALRAQGIRVAMDDFGTGYSSLSILQRLSLDKLKIDRSFVSGDPPQAQADAGTGVHLEIANTIITLAQHLKLTTLAEGIETDAQRRALLAAGCELGQGYFFSRPLPEQDFLLWLEKNST